MHACQSASRARVESSSEGRVQVEVTWTQREIERGKRVSYNRTLFRREWSRRSQEALHVFLSACAVSNV